MDDFSTNPYVGPRPFERTPSDKAKFAGRDWETEEIVAYILGHPVVLVYAQSGAGKTSLFNAQIIPVLECEYKFEVMPTSRVQGILPDGLNPEQIDNIFVFNVLRSIAPKTNPQKFLKMTLAEFLREECQRNYDKEEGRDVARALVIDQFEELFGIVPPRCLEQREGFFQQIAKTLDEDPLLRVVLIIREDFLAQLDPFTRLLPEGLKIRFRLECLKREQALEAINKPLVGTDIGFEEGAAERLVLDLSRIRTPSLAHEGWVEGLYVEPVQLQVVCRKLWSNLDTGTKVISREDIKALDVDRSLADFYEELIQGAAETKRVSEYRLRKWFSETLVTPIGTRGTVFKGRETTGGIPNEMVEWLAKQHLIRAEYRSGASWYELTHDRFIEPILTSNKAWFAGREDVERAILFLEQKAAEWISRGRGPGAMLDEVELREVDRWLDDPRLKDLGGSIDLQNYIQVSRQAIQKARKEKETAQRRELEQALALADMQRKRTEENARSARLRLKVGVALLVASIASIASISFASYAWVQRKIALQRHELVAAINDLDIDPERSLIQAYRVAQEASPQNGQIILEAADILGRAIQASRVRWSLPISADLPIVEYNHDGKFLAGITEKDKVTLWDTNTHANVHELVGHKGYILAMDFAAGVDRLATGGADKTARVWDTASGKESFKLQREAEVTAVTLSDDGKWLATATSGPSGSLRIRDIDANEPYGKLDGQKLPYLTDISFSPNGKYLATTDSYGTLSVWDVVSGKRQFEQNHDDEIVRVRFSPDGEAIATGSLDYTARIWDARTGDQRRRLSGHTNSVLGLAFSPDGNRIATASGDTTVKIYDVESGRDLFTIRGSSSPVESVSFSPDGLFVATASRDGTARIWDVSGYTQVTNIMAFSEDGRRCATADIDGKSIIWNAESGDVILNGHVDNITFIALNRRGDRFATGNKDGLVTLWDGETGKKIRNLPVLTDQLSHTGKIQNIKFNHEGNRLVTADINGEAILWDTETGENMLEMPHEFADIGAVAFNSDDTKIATSDGAGVVKIWDIASSQSRELKGHTDRISSMTFHPNGKYLITASMDGSARLWDLKSPDSPPRLLEQHQNMIMSDAKFSPEGTRMVVSMDNTAKIWDIESPEHPPLILKGHSSIVEKVVFSTDGQRLATASWDRTARIWDASTGKELSKLTHSHEVNDLHFSADGTRLTTVSADGKVRVQPLDIKELMELAKKRITRQMKPEEYME